MKTSSLDILENARLPPEQAKAILQMMEGELDDRQLQLATRTDIAAVRSDFEVLRSDFAVLRSDFTVLRSDFSVFKSEMRAEMAAFRSEMRAEFEAFRAEMKAEFQALRAEFRAADKDLEIRVANRFNAQLVSMTGIFALIMTVYSGMMAVVIHYLTAK